MSFEEVLAFIFGGQFDLSKVTNILAIVWAVVMSILQAKAKKKILSADVEETETQKQLKLARQEINALEKVVSALSDVFITTFISSNTIPVEAKRVIGQLGDKLNKLAGIPLAETTEKLIEAATTAVPQADLIKHKEEIEEAAKVAEEAIDTANDVAQSAIDKLTV